MTNRAGGRMKRVGRGRVARPVPGVMILMKRTKGHLNSSGSYPGGNPKEVHGQTYARPALPQVGSFPTYVWAMVDFIAGGSGSGVSPTRQV